MKVLRVPIVLASQAIPGSAKAIEPGMPRIWGNPVVLGLRGPKCGALIHGSSAMELESADCLRQPDPADAENKSCKCKRRDAPEKENGRIPESFDELAVHLNRKFGRLAVEVERMAKELREAQEQSERLRYRLLNPPIS